MCAIWNRLTPLSDVFHFSDGTDVDTLLFLLDLYATTTTCFQTYTALLPQLWLTEYYLENDWRNAHLLTEAMC